MTDILPFTARKEANGHVETSLGALAPGDRKRVLSECEAVVTVHLKGFAKLGMELGEVIEKHKLRDGFLAAARALSMVSKDKLWQGERPPGGNEPFYRSFKDYLDRRWSISRRHAYRLIDAGDAVAALSPFGHILPLRESQVRPLVGLPASVASDAWSRATKGGRQPTAEEVQRHSDESLASAALGKLTLKLSAEDALKAKQRSIDNAEKAAKATIALEPGKKRLALIEKLGGRMLRLMAGDEDATSLQKAAMALASGVGGKVGKRLHEAAELVRQALSGKGRKRRAG